MNKAVVPPSRCPHGYEAKHYRLRPDLGPGWVEPRKTACPLCPEDQACALPFHVGEISEPVPEV